MTNFLITFVKDYQVLFKPFFYVCVTIFSIIVNFGVVGLWRIENKTELDAIRSETVHKRIDGFAGTLSAFRDEAYRVEREANELQRQNELLIDCINRGDCKRYPELLKKRDRTQVNIAKSYEPIRELLGETYTKEK